MKRTGKHQKPLIIFVCFAMLMIAYVLRFRLLWLSLWMVIGLLGVSVVYGFQTPYNLIESVAWSPDGTKIAVGGGIIPCDPINSADSYAVQILNSQTLALEQRLYGNECDTYKVAWSPDGTRIAAAGIDENGTHVWNVATGQVIAAQQELLNGSIDVAWYPDGTKLAVVTVGSSILTLDANSGETLNSFPYGAGEIAFSPDGTRLLGIPPGLNDAYILDVASQQRLTHLTGHTKPVGTGAWSPDGQRIATGSADKTIRIWDATSFQTVLTLQGHTDLVNQVAWSPDSTRVASSSDDGTVRIWDATTGAQIGIFQYTGPVYALAWSPDGSKLAYGGSDGKVHIVPAPQTPAATPSASSMDRGYFAPNGIRGYFSASG